MSRNIGFIRETSSSLKLTRMSVYIAYNIPQF